jgi:ankyrin repeat protein
MSISRIPNQSPFQDFVQLEGLFSEKTEAPINTNPSRVTEPNHSNNRLLQPLEFIREMDNAIQEEDLKRIVDLLKTQTQYTSFYSPASTLPPSDSLSIHLYSPLCTAIKFKKQKVTQLLLEKGLDPNFQPNYCRTPLFQALVLRDLEIIQLLLKYKANPNAVDEYSQEASLYFAMRMKCSLPIIALLLKHKANPNQVCHVFTPLEKALTSNGTPELVDLLLRYRADPNTSGGEMSSPIELATCDTFNNPLESLHLLIKYGARPKDPPNFIPQQTIKGRFFKEYYITTTTILSLWTSGHYTYCVKPFSLDSFSRKYLSLKLIGNANSLRGSIPFHHNSASYRLSFEGSTVPFFAIAYAKMLRSLPPSKQRLERIVELEQDGDTRTNGDLLQQIHNPNKLTMTPLSSCDHSMFLVFSSSYMCVCDRSGYHWPTTKFFKIDPSKMTLELIKKIEDSRWATLKETFSFAYQELPSALSPTHKPIQDKNCKAFQKTSPKTQKSGCCSCAAVKAGNKAAILLQKYAQAIKNKKHNPVDISRLCQNTFIAYKQESLAFRQFVVKECKEAFPLPREPSITSLIKKAENKIEKHKKSAGKTHRFPLGLIARVISVPILGTLIGITARKIFETLLRKLL